MQSMAARDCRNRGWSVARLRQDRELLLAAAAARRPRRSRRAEAQVPISRMSSLFLVLLRSALPGLDKKRASKMALALACADDQAVTAKRLVAQVCAATLW